VLLGLPDWDKLGSQYGEVTSRFGRFTWHTVSVGHCYTLHTSICWYTYIPPYTTPLPVYYNSDLLFQKIITSIRLFLILMILITASLQSRNLPLTTCSIQSLRLNPLHHLLVLHNLLLWHHLPQLHHSVIKTFSDDCSLIASSLRSYCLSSRVHLSSQP
jgi:hypothetical protein